MRISDWSSDVCSSDLDRNPIFVATIFVVVIVDIVCISQGRTALIAALLNKQNEVVDKLLAIPGISINGKVHSKHQVVLSRARSEERRVGKECVSTCRSRWSPYH